MASSQLQDVRGRLGDRELDPRYDGLQEPGEWTIVEAPLAFLEEEVEVVAWDAVIAVQVALGLVPEVLDAVDVAGLPELLEPRRPHLPVPGSIHATALRPIRQSQLNKEAGWKVNPWRFSPSSRISLLFALNNGENLESPFHSGRNGHKVSQKLAGSVPRYYFHIRDNGDDFVEDPAGVDLSDLDVASDQFRQIVRDVLSEDLWLTDALASRRFEITDEGGRTVLLLPFANIGMRAERRSALRARR